jgi:hypothetical protein
MAKQRGRIKNRKQYEGLKRRGMSKERAARIANSPGASSRGGKKASRSTAKTRKRSASQGGSRAQKQRAGRKGGRAASRKRT